MFSPCCSDPVLNNGCNGGNLYLIQALAQKSVQEKESIMSVRYGWTNLSLGSVTVWHHLAEPHDAITMTLGTGLPIRTSHSCQILIVWYMYLCSRVDGSRD